MEEGIGIGGGLSILLSAPVLLLCLIIAIVACRHLLSPAGRFLILALWLRFAMSALHTFTFQSSPVGLTWNAIASIGVVFFGFVTARKRPIAGIMFPIFAIMAIVIASGIYAGNPASILGVTVKYLYLIILILCIIDALEDLGVDKLCKYLMVPFAVPVILQLLSILVGASKGTEEGGGVSYVGGFNHESSFSIIIINGIFLLVFIRTSSIIKLGLLTSLFVSILFANYRTAIIAVSPMLLFALVSGLLRRFLPSQRSIIVLLIMVFGSIGALLVAWVAEDRFSDLAVLAQTGTGIIKDPQTFTIADRHIMSGRALIWSRYIYGYLAGNSIQQLLGNGPESWGAAFGIYAHNTLISTLYEYGIVGVSLVILLWIWMATLAIKSGESYGFRLTGAHLSFVVLAMATMPMWLIEGLVLYAFICGFSIYGFRQDKSFKSLKLQES